MTLFGLKAGKTSVYAAICDEDENIYAVAEIKVTVTDNGVVTALRVDSLPNSIDLTYKKDASLEGLKVTAIYSNGSEVDVTDKVTVTGFDTGKPVGTKAATVEFEGITATFNYEVSYNFGQWLILIFLFGWLWY